MNLMNNKKRFFVLCVTLLFVVQGCTNQQQRKSNEEIIEVETKNEIDKEKQSTLSLTFEEVKAKFQKLIPVSGGYFITHTKIDSAFYCEFMFEKHKQIDISKDQKPTLNKKLSQKFGVPILDVWSPHEISSKTEKWGLIDSSGKVLIPFVCDGINIKKNLFKVSILTCLSNLNTGVPRYVYVGKSYLISSENWKWKDEKTFDKMIEFSIIPNFNYDVINKGSKYYLP